MKAVKAAELAHFSKDDTDPAFHYILSRLAHESPRSEQLFDCVRHTLKSSSCQNISMWQPFIQTRITCMYMLQ